MKLNEVIKLRGNTNTNLKPFMDAFVDVTTESPLGKGRLYGDVLIDLSPFDGDIHISDIMAAGDKAKGSGTRALKFLTDLADRFNVRLSGTAKAYSKDDRHIQDSDQLIQWYKKHGFTAAGDKITYNPKRLH